MIEDEELIGMTIDERMARGNWRAEMRMSNERANSLKSAQATIEIFAEGKLVVVFGVEGVADAAQLWIGAERFEIVLDAVGRQRDPADDAADEIMFVCEAEQPVRFFEALAASTEMTTSTPAGWRMGACPGGENRGGWRTSIHLSTVIGCGVFPEMLV